MEQCPERTLRNSLICLDCETNCKRCGTTASFCQECENEYKLYNGDCINTCPDSITIEISGVC